MSCLSYNGVNLRVCHVRHYLRRAVWEGPDYLYTVHRIRVSALWSPTATSYQTGDPANDNLNAQDVLGQPPHLTDRVRHKLMMPRRKLVFSAGDYAQRGVDAAGRPSLKNYVVNPLTGKGPEGTLETLVADPLVILESPPPPAVTQAKFPGVTFACDAANGPVPLSCTVTQLDGFKTFRVEYEVETYVDEQWNVAADRGRAVTFGGVLVGQQVMPSPVLSWLWASRQTIDEYGYSTIGVRGRVVFRSDVLDAMNRLLGERTADSFREQIFHRVLPGFKRESVNVRVAEDGLSMEYELVDQEQQVNIDQSLATKDGLRTNFIARIEGDAWVSSQSQNRDALLLQSAADMLNGQIGTGLKRLTNIVPRSEAGVVVRAWGNNNATLADLQYVCESVVTARLGTFAADLDPQNNPADAFRYGVSVRHSWPLTRRYYQISATAMAGTAGSFIHLVDGVRRVFPKVFGDNPLFNVTDPQGNRIYTSGLPLTPRRDQLADGQQMPGPPFPAPSPLSGAYGQLATRLLTQALRDPNTSYNAVSGGNTFPARQFFGGTNTLVPFAFL